MVRERGEKGRKRKGGRGNVGKGEGKAKGKYGGRENVDVK